MRASEFLPESTKKGKIAPRHQEPSRGIHKVIDSIENGDDYGSDYSLYRLSMAAACTDGIETPHTKSKSWIGTGKTIYPYSKADQEIMKKAYAAIGVKYKDVNAGDLESCELGSTNSTSPVSNWNKKTKVKNESATAGATSSASIASVPNPHISPGPARGKKSYIGSPGQSGTKAPPQPKPKKQSPKQNALDMSNVSLFGTPLKRK